MDRRAEKRNRRAFKRAQRTCPPGHTVAGTYREDGTPVYFHVPAVASEEECRRIAFEHRYGREMNNYERVFLKNAEARHAARR